MGQPPKSVRDICFTLVESADLRRFTGTWRIESRDNMRSRLIYAVEVLPQPWLPVGAWPSRRMHAASARLTHSPLQVSSRSASAPTWWAIWAPSVTTLRC